MSSNSKNYTAQGGALTVIGGELQILGRLTVDPDAEVVGLFGSSISETQLVGVGPVDAQPDSTATSVAQLREDFNALLGKLRAGGILADDSEPTASDSEPAAPAVGDEP